MHLVIIGPPGCGKGTISKKIENDYNIRHLSTGELLRQTDNKEIKDTLKIGNFISDELITKLVVEEIRKISHTKNEVCCLLDGFPRTLNQVGVVKVKLVLLIKVKDNLCIKRIKGRNDNREDDINEDVIIKRLKIYHERTDPVIKYYKEKGLVEEIDGFWDVETVYSKVREILNKKCRF